LGDFSEKGDSREEGGFLNLNRKKKKVKPSIPKKTVRGSFSNGGKKKKDLNSH